MDRVAGLVDNPASQQLPTINAVSGQLGLEVAVIGPLLQGLIAV